MFSWVLSESKSGAGYAATRITIKSIKGINGLTELRVPHAKRDHVFSVSELSSLFEQHPEISKGPLPTHTNFTNAVLLTGSVGSPGVKVAPERRIRLSLGDDARDSDLETVVDGRPLSLAWWDVATGIDAAAVPPSPGYHPSGGNPGPFRNQINPNALNAEHLGESAFHAFREWEKNVERENAIRVVVATSGTMPYFNGRLVFNRMLLELAREGIVDGEGVKRPVAFLFVARGTPIDSSFLTETFCKTCPRSVDHPEKNHLLVDAAIWDFFQFATPEVSGRIADLENTTNIHDRVTYDDSGEFTAAEAASVLRWASAKGLLLVVEAQEVDYLPLWLRGADIVLATTGAGTGVDITWVEAMRRYMNMKPVMGVLGGAPQLVGPGGDAEVL